jgi:hypothetical protein
MSTSNSASENKSLAAINKNGSSTNKTSGANTASLGSNKAATSGKSTLANTNTKTSNTIEKELPKTGESNQLSGQLSLLGLATVFSAGAFLHHLEKKKSL